MDDDEQQQQHQQQNTYVAQLHQVFAGCDPLGTGYLGRSELTELCSQLHLDDQANLITEHLLGDDPDAKVDFDEFKDKFVFLLAHSVDSDQQEPSEDDDDDNKSIHFSSPEREVSPKYVWGSKKYGRRSRPDLDSNDTDNDLLSDFSDSEVFITQAPTCNSEETLDVVAANPIRTRVQSGTQTHQGAKRRRRMQSNEEKLQLPAESTNVACAVDCGEGENAKLGRESPVGTSGSENEEDYLKSIWLKLGVGSDGFLNQEGLARVCEHIGMEKMSEEVIMQLFEKLDVDQDGKISFEEFLHLFRNGETSSTGSSAVSTTVIDANQNSARNIPQQSLSAKDHQMTSAPSAISESGVFSSIDQEKTGYVEPEGVIELWETLGISGGYRILKELGFSTGCHICLVDLSNCLEDLLQNSADSDMAQVAFVSYQHELKFLRKSIDQMIIEREKLRSDVADANTRASLLAQEVDDHHAKLEKSSQAKIMNLEKKFQEQSRRLQDELDHEREQLNSQMSSIKQNLEEELATLRDAEARVREQLILLQKENQNMDQEIRELTHKLSEAQKINQQQQLEAESMLALKQEFAYEEQCKALADELEALRTENKQLKDQNDEKNAEVESLKQQLIAKSNVGNSGCSFSGNLTGDVDVEDGRRDDGGFGTGEEGTGGLTVSEQCHQHRRNGSWLSDYIKVPTIKRRGSGTPLTTSSTEDVSEEDNASQLVKPKRKLSGSLSCGDSREGTDDIALLINNPDAQKPSTMEDNRRCRVKAAEVKILDWSDDEEYLQLKHLQNATLDQHCQQQTFQNHNHPELEEAIKKLAIKKVFAILKQRFIEEHLQEVEHQNNPNYTRDVNESNNPTIDLISLNSENVFLNGVSKTKYLTDRGFAANIQQELQSSGIPDEENTKLPIKNNFNEPVKIKNADFDDNPDMSCLQTKPEFKNIAKESWWWNQEVATREEGIEADIPSNQQSAKKNQDLKKPRLTRQSNVENDVHGEQVNCTSNWNKLLETERLRWKTLVQSMENHNKALQNKLISKEISHKKDMLKSEVFWREQVEQERQELEEDRAHLQDQILGLEYQLENSALQKFGHVVNATHFFDLQASDAEKDLIEENPKPLATTGYKLEQTQGTYLRRSKSWRENVVCGQRASNAEETWRTLDAKRKAWTKSRNNLEALAIEIDSYENQSDNSDSEYDDDEDSEDTFQHNNPASCLQKQFNRPRLKRRKCRDSIERELGKLQNVVQDSSSNSPRFGQGKRCHQSKANHELKSNCVIDIGMLISINQHMKQQENRCRQLEASLKAKTLQAERTLTETKQGYDEEIKRISQLLHKTRAQLKEETNKVKEKNDKLLQADVLIKELYLENAHLMKNLQFLEEKTHKTEKSNLTLQQKCQALNQLLTEMCRNPTSP